MRKWFIDPNPPKSRASIAGETVRYIVEAVIGGAWLLLILWMLTGARPL